jgi:hypothetical protein
LEEVIVTAREIANEWLPRALKGVQHFVGEAYAAKVNYKSHERKKIRSNAETEHVI